MNEKIIKEESMSKIVSVLKSYSKEQFVKDVIAGIIVAIIALPLSIALALASGVGPEQGIYTAIALLLFLKRMADVLEIRDWKYVEEEEEGLKVVPKGTLVYEIAGPMFFAVADKFLQVSEDKDTKVMVIRMKGVPAMDATALRSLEKVLDDCRHKGITLLLSHVRDQPMHVMEKAGFVEKLGKENFCENIDAALERAKEIC